MDPLWAISGRFAGWRSGDILYDRSGTNAGYFVDAVAYRLDGHYLGELYDDSTLGARSGIHPRRGARAEDISIAVAPYADRAGRPIAGWKDPEFP